MKTEKIFFTLYKSPVGEIYLYATNEALVGLTFSKNKEAFLKKIASYEVVTKKNAFLSEVIQQLKEYFKGERKEFELKLQPIGTDFQKKAWSALRQIPYGKTSTYKAQATQLKKSQAVRAVGTANGRNPISIVVPCHRVIGSNGSLSGYAGGLEVKSYLLELEKDSSQ